MTTTVPAEMAAYLQSLQSLTPESLPDLDRHLAEQVRFRDPFNDVRGREAVRRVFEKMFADLQDVRFVVEEAVGSSGLCYARWRFHARFRKPGRPPLDFVGISEIRMNDEGKVAEHQDFWDPTAAVLDHVPALGFVLRRLKRRLAVS